MTEARYLALTFAFERMSLEKLNNKYLKLHNSVGNDGYSKLYEELRLAEHILKHRRKCIAKGIEFKPTNLRIKYLAQEHFALNQVIDWAKKFDVSLVLGLKRRRKGGLKQLRNIFRQEIEHPALPQQQEHVEEKKLNASLKKRVNYLSDLNEGMPKTTKCRQMVVIFLREKHPDIEITPETLYRLDKKIKREGKDFLVTQLGKGPISKNTCDNVFKKPRKHRQTHSGFYHKSDK